LCLGGGPPARALGPATFGSVATATDSGSVPIAWTSDTTAEVSGQSLRL
jgi:hypothetical protein